MAMLVSLAAFEAFLGGAVASEGTLRQDILDHVEALFLGETGRVRAPFVAAATGRVEVLRGTGSDVLHLDYPIAAVTTIKLGHDTATPDETLDPADKTKVIWTAGDNHITRVDGGRWGRFGVPAYVHITYNTQADLPVDASLAVMRVAAAIYRQRGAEDASSETIGGQTSSLIPVTELADWGKAVANHTRIPL